MSITSVANHFRIAIITRVRLMLNASLARTFRVPVDTPLISDSTISPTVYLKGKDEILDYTCDWTDWLADCDDTILYGDITFPVASNLIVTTTDFDDNKVFIMAGESSVGTWPIKFYIDTIAGRYHEVEIILEVR